MTEVTAVVMIVLGLLLVIHPGGAVLLVCRLLGLVMAGAGFVLLLASLGERNNLGSRGNADVFRCVLGAILLALGILIAFRPGIILGFAGVLFAVILFVRGVSDVKKMLAVRQAGDESWKFSLFTAALTFFAGLVVLIAPFGSASLIMTIAGIFLILDGIFELYLILRVSNRGKRNMYNHSQSDRVIDGDAEEIDK